MRLDAGFGSTAAAAAADGSSGADGAAAEPAACGTPAERPLIALQSGNAMGAASAAPVSVFSPRCFRYCATKSQPTQLA